MPRKYHSLLRCPPSPPPTPLCYCFDIRRRRHVTIAVGCPPHSGIPFIHSLYVQTINKYATTAVNKTQSSPLSPLLPFNCLALPGLPFPTFVNCLLHLPGAAAQPTPACCIFKHHLTSFTPWYKRKHMISVPSVFADHHSSAQPKDPNKRSRQLLAHQKQKETKVSRTLLTPFDPELLHQLYSRA